VSSERHIVVIGGGPAGIGAGIALAERGVVVDGGPEVGGLARTVEVDGAVFDLGGHSFHTPHADVRALVCSALDMVEQPRDARCHSHGQMIPYPFQAHFRELDDPDVVRECAAGLAAARKGTGAAHLEEFLSGRYGAGIARHFLLPYNRKLWKADLTGLAVDWVGERIAPPESVDEPPADSAGRRRPLRDDTIVAYPARGGFGEIWRALARRLGDLRLGKSVMRVPHHGILAEVSCHVDQRWPEGELERQVVEGLVAMKLVDSLADVRCTRVLRVRHGYPLPTHARAPAVERLRHWLEERGVHTVGRFGEWAYINSDEALRRGLALGRLLLESV
jgi:protoporphyrinogen oxidase